MGIYSYAAKTRSLVDMLICSFVYPSLKVEPQPLQGKTAIVTGANVGIGLEAARKLASYGATVTLACRDVNKGEVARQDIMSTTGSKAVEVRQIDFGNFASVKAFVADWGDKPVDILINNAGATFYKYTLTPDGHEATYGVNFLSHVLLTVLLLPNFNRYGRVVNVSSIGSYAALRRDVDPSDLDGSKYLESQGLKEGDMFEASVCLGLYSKSKLNQVVFTKVLQEKLDASPRYSGKNLVVSACHPGAVLSSIHERHAGNGAEEYQKFMKRWVSTINKVGVSNEQGACTPVFLAVDPSVAKKKGGYWDRMTNRTPNPLVEDAPLRNELWTGWLKECGLSEVL